MIVTGSETWESRANQSNICKYIPDVGKFQDGANILEFNTQSSFYYIFELNM